MHRSKQTTLGSVKLYCNELVKHPKNPRNLNQLWENILRVYKGFNHSKPTVSSLFRGKSPYGCQASHFYRYVHNIISPPARTLCSCFGGIEDVHSSVRCAVLYKPMEAKKRKGTDNGGPGGLNRDMA